MATDESNGCAAMVEKFWKSLDEAKWQELAALLHDDIRITYPGTGSYFSGIYEGLEGAQRFLSKLVDGITRTETVVDMMESCGSPFVAASRVHESAKCADGREYTLNWIAMFHLDNTGTAIQAINIFVDTQLVEQLFPVSAGPPNGNPHAAAAATYSSNTPSATTATTTTSTSSSSSYSIPVPTTYVTTAATYDDDDDAIITNPKPPK
eukprot:TRINITY_DN67256_c0_g1_i1.p1 TRINITY_DN67256_c0_g1~~TRINITY_DN67256_c0_g1_i1.p1  ORF type:complete len:215 (+),score=45.92 TRINITY_DN67256_c0_g1_i1:24-647(+)